MCEYVRLSCGCCLRGLVLISMPRTKRARHPLHGRLGGSYPNYNYIIQLLENRHDVSARDSGIVPVRGNAAGRREWGYDYIGPSILRVSS